MDANAFTPHRDAVREPTSGRERLSSAFARMAARGCQRRSADAQPMRATSLGEFWLGDNGDALNTSLRTCRSFMAWPRASQSSTSVSERECQLDGNQHGRRLSVECPRLEAPSTPSRIARSVYRGLGLPFGFRKGDTGIARTRNACREARQTCPIRQHCDCVGIADDDLVSEAALLNASGCADQPLQMLLLRVRAELGAIVVRDAQIEVGSPLVG